MPVVALPGSSFTFKAGATPTDYTIQVRNMSINGAANVIDEFTLGPNQTTVATNTADSVDLDMLYDSDTGAYQALYTAYKALTPIEVEITQGTTGHKWTGDAMIVASLNLTADATATASFTCTLQGPLTAATQT